MLIKLQNSIEITCHDMKKYYSQIKLYKNNYYCQELDIPVMSEVT